MLLSVAGLFFVLAGNNSPVSAQGLLNNTGALVNSLVPVLPTPETTPDSQSVTKPQSQNQSTPQPQQLTQVQEGNSSTGTLTSALTALVPLAEDSAHPEVKRTEPIPYQKQQSAPQKSAAPSFAALSAETLGPNLILNPSVESFTTSGPSNWQRGGYGSNARSFTYPAPPHTGTKALGVTVSNYTSGDAKWFFDYVNVTPGKMYQFSDFYKSDVPSTLTAQFKLSNGSFTYLDLTQLAPASTYTAAAGRFTVPSGVVAVTVFHLIKQNGTLSTDEFSLNEVTPGSGGEGDSLIQNGGFETAGSAGKPANWSRGGFGSNTRAFSYLSSGGVNNSKAARVAITSYSSGDAKWYFDPVVLSPGTYTYSNSYVANIPSTITIQLQMQNGSFVYKDIATLPAAGSFTPMSVDFTVPANVKNVTVFHLIEGVGQLTIDTVSLALKSGPTGIFTTGAVSLTFDDNRLSQYQNAFPKLTSSGLKGTFYVISRQTNDDGFATYMSWAQITELFNAGHEIGAHTRTHRDLTTLSAADQQTEIQGSRQDLINRGLGSVLTFAYPFGSYNGSTIGFVESAGLQSARATIDGHVTPSSDRYQLQRYSVEVDTTFNQVKQEIDKAATNKDWLILTFHQINNGTDRYTVSPTIFNQIIDYLVQKGIPVVTVSQGMQSMP